MYFGNSTHTIEAFERQALVEERPINIPYERSFLCGSLALPPSPRGMVLIANDGGAGRHVPALRALAHQLRVGGLGTLIVDMLQIEEEPLGVTEMAKRIGAARHWLTNGDQASPALVILGLGLAAPSSLLSVAAQPAHVDAVIACGPFPDRAGIALDHVTVPTLFIAHAGSFDDTAANRRALGALHGERDLAVLSEQEDAIQGGMEIANTALIFLARRSCHLHKAG